MLYVNAEVAIKKWKERMAKLEELKETNPDATLYAPNNTFDCSRIEQILKWMIQMVVLLDGTVTFLDGIIERVYMIGRAEGLKRSRANFMRMQKKQKMCERWWKAHQGKGIYP